MRPSTMSACRSPILEQRTPDGDSVPRSMSWKKGTYLASDFFYLNSEGDYYVFRYIPEEFYAQLD